MPKSIFDLLPFKNISDISNEEKKLILNLNSKLNKRKWKFFYVQLREHEKDLSVLANNTLRYWSNDHNRTVQSIENFILRYGEKQGKISHDAYINSQRVSLKKAWKEGRKNLNDCYALMPEEYAKKHGISLAKVKEMKSKQSSKNMTNANKTMNENHASRPVNINYWLEKGFSYEEAKEKLSERQRTFTLEKCVQKYGEENGLIRWKERQQKWMNSYTKSNFSKVSQKLFWKIYEIIKNEYLEIYFKELNKEYVLETTKSYIKPDFYIPSLKKIIEFDGDYWHKNDDQQRDEEISKIEHKILHVKESDFKRCDQHVVDVCLRFIRN